MTRDYGTESYWQYREIKIANDEATKKMQFF